VLQREGGDDVQKSFIGQQVAVRRKGESVHHVRGTRSPPAVRETSGSGVEEVLIVIVHGVGTN